MNYLLKTSISSILNRYFLMLRREIMQTRYQCAKTIQHGVILIPIRMHANTVGTYCYQYILCKNVCSGITSWLCYRQISTDRSSFQCDETFPHVDVALFRSFPVDELALHYSDHRITLQCNMISGFAIQHACLPWIRTRNLEWSMIAI